MNKKASPSDRLESLEKRIEKARNKPEVEPSGASLALRMGTELVAGVRVGTGFGYGVDYLLGTMPLFLVIFLFIGAAAGGRMMMQTSQRYHPEETNEDLED